jgi:hypothetical protein
MCGEKKFFIKTLWILKKNSEIFLFSGDMPMQVMPILISVL